ncbi:MAG: hypothetical protein NTY01_05075 [Verrucomicrobia bacterium]|nr:hypothetical protein [Verrucomicrobiota bacterium]
MKLFRLVSIAAASLLLPGTFSIFAAQPALPTHQDPFSKEVAALPAEGQVERVMAKLKQMNRGFVASETHKVENEKVTEFSLHTTSPLKEISALRALVNLQKLECIIGTPDIATLDLRPLHAMSLTELKLRHITVNDLRPLSAMPLVILNLDACRIPDLSPLKGIRLKRLSLWSTSIPDLAPLAGMPLEWLNCSKTKVRDLSPLKGAPLKVLCCDDTDVSNLSALEGMPLQILRCDVKAAKRNAKTLQSISTLEKINDIPAAEFLKTVKNR